MKATSGIAPLCLSAAMLASCGGGNGDEQAPEMKAGGTILERSITDDMLPYDTLSSQPPLAKPEITEGTGVGPGEKGAAEGDSAADTVDGAPANGNADGEPALADE